MRRAPSSTAPHLSSGVLIFGAFDAALSASLVLSIISVRASNAVRARVMASPGAGPPDAPSPKRAGRSLFRISIRCASSAESGKTTSTSPVPKGTDEFSTEAARRKVRSGAHFAAASAPSARMAPANTVHAARGVSSWSKTRGTKR